MSSFSKHISIMNNEFDPHECPSLVFQSVKILCTPQTSPSLTFMYSSWPSSLGLGFKSDDPTETTDIRLWYCVTGWLDQYPTAPGQCVLLGCGCDTVSCYLTHSCPPGGGEMDSGITQEYLQINECNELWSPITNSESLSIARHSLQSRWLTDRWEPMFWRDMAVSVNVKC